MMAGITGDPSRLASLSRRAKAAADARGDLAVAALAMKSEGTALFLQGDSAGAMKLGKSAVALARAACDGYWLAHVLGEIGVVAADAGDLVQGANMLEEALAIDRARGDRLLSAVRLSDLGVVAHMSGDEAAAFSHYTESVRNFWEAGGVWYLASPLAGLAAIAASREPEAAARLIGAAEALRERGGQSGWRFERERDEQTVERLWTALGEEAFDREKSIGRSMPLSEGVAIAGALSIETEIPAGVPVGSGEVLSARELEVLRLLVAGHSDKVIAEMLEIRPRTASKHVENILAKLGVSTRGEASVYAVRNGLA
jgi:non-specific serine/threonine protein kinase